MSHAPCTRRVTCRRGASRHPNAARLNFPDRFFVLLDLHDTIVGFAGEPVDSLDALQRMLTENRVGIAAKLDVLRRTQRLELTVTPSEAA